MDYLEEYGRGIDIIFNKMDEWGLLDPIFKNTANSFKVILMGEKLSDLNNRQIMIWDYLTENEKITVQDCEELLTETSRVTINRDLKKMRDKNLINKIGKSTNTHYEPAF